MDDFCSNPYGCEWNISHFWHAMNRLGRLDVIALAILLTYALFTFVCALIACNVVQRSAKDARALTQFNQELKLRLRDLKSIAFVSPYLGLIGTCVGIMSAFTGIGMEKHAALAMMASRVAASLVTTGAGIIVAVSAIVLSHSIPTPAALFPEKVATTRLPLGRRISELPAFALLTAPVLGLSMSAFLVFSSNHGPTGLEVGLAPARCEFDGDERVIVLSIKEDGRAFINQEHQDWNNLAGRLSEIYRLRVHRRLYLYAQDEVPFQTIADAIGIATNAQVTGTNISLHIAVRLVTPAALKSECPDPRHYRSGTYPAMEVRH
jgi:biopolymer transport protein ExbD